MNQELLNGTIFIRIGLIIRVMQAEKHLLNSNLVFLLPRLQQNYHIKSRKMLIFLIREGHPFSDTEDSQENPGLPRAVKTDRFHLPMSHLSLNGRPFLLGLVFLRFSIIFCCSLDRRNTKFELLLNAFLSASL